MSTAANPEVHHYRFATPITGSAHESYTLVGTEDQSFEITLDADYCLIMKIGNDGDMAANLDYQLQYDIDDAGSWAPVNATSSNVRVAASGDTDGATSTSERLGTISGHTYQTSVLEEVDGLIPDNIVNLQSFEFYYAITFRSADLSGGETIKFRLATIPAGTALMTVTPTATVPVQAKTALGTPDIPVITASGAAEVIKTASGTPSIAAIISNGVAEIIKTAVGAATIAVITASGIAEVIKTTSGTPSIPTIEASGSAEVIRTADGTPSIAVITASGAVEIIKTASGAPSIPPVEASGAATKGLAHAASGNPSISAIEASGAAELIRVANGTPSIPIIQASGIIDLTRKASGNPSITAITASGVAEVIRVASGTPSIASITASGAAEVIKTANGGPSIPTLTASGIAEVSRVASGTPSIPVITVSGNALVNPPKVWLNNTQTTVGADQMVVTAYSDTSITFDDPSGGKTGSLFLGVERYSDGEIGWIAVTVNSGLKTASGNPSISAIEASGVAEIIRS
jgi:hypothetical protein